MIDSVFIVRMSNNIEEFDIDQVAEDAKNKTAKQLASKLISASKSERASRVLMESLAEAFN
jgi:hypothetical protein